MSHRFKVINRRRRPARKLRTIKMHAIIVCERDEWEWRIEPQEDCSEGVDIVYEGSDGTKTRTCIGTVDDAKALADAILAYVNFAKGEKEQWSSIH